MPLYKPIYHNNAPENLKLFLGTVIEKILKSFKKIFLGHSWPVGVFERRQKRFIKMAFYHKKFGLVTFDCFETLSLSGIHGKKVHVKIGKF